MGPSSPSWSVGASCAFLRGSLEPKLFGVELLQAGDDEHDVEELVHVLDRDRDAVLSADDRERLLVDERLADGRDHPIPSAADILAEKANELADLCEGPGA